MPSVSNYGTRERRLVIKPVIVTLKLGERLGEYLPRRSANGQSTGR